VVGGEVAATVSAAAGGATVKPKIDAKRTKGTKYVVRAPLDPEVQIRVLQGPDVLSYLQEADTELAEIAGVEPGAMRNLPENTTTYFVDQPLEDASFEEKIGPQYSFELEVQLPDVADLRAAIALEVRNQEDGSLTRTPPIFATQVGDRVVLTDLTIDMLRDEHRQILTELAEANSDVSALAWARDQDIAEVWQALVAATEELGAGSVGDAAAFTATATGMRSPVGAH
jgi:hypothetical protein